MIQRPPTFANTLEAMERAGHALTPILQRVLEPLCSSHTSDALQALEREWSPRFAAHHTSITTNAALFKRIDTLFANRATLGLNAEQRRLLEKTHLSFVRAGARLEGEARERYKALSQTRAQLSTRFGQNVLADEKAYTLVLTKEAELEGLPPFVLDAARGAAEERGLTGAHVITLSRSLIEPFLTFSSRRDLREQAWRAWAARGENAGATDNRQTITELVKLRIELANLLGYPTFADYSLDDSMAKTPARVRELLDRVWAPALHRARDELAKLQAMAAQDDGGITIEPWDWRYYAEKSPRCRV